MGNTYTNISATTAAVANRFVVSANMKVGTYTIANASPAWQGGCLVTVTHTAVSTVDTLGTITIAGTDLSGQAISEVITPLNGTVATGTKVFRTVTSATGAGWVSVAGDDTIVIGCAAGSIVLSGGGRLSAIVVNATAAATVVISDARGTIATLPASAVVGTYDYEDIDVANLKVATTSTNDITVIHTPTMPSSYTLA
jgi:hypothetical protein